MVTGLDNFREWFDEFKNQYVVIGGTACDLLMEEAELPFRATKDIDIVLIIEALSADFGRKFWEYVKEAGYEYKNKSTGEPQFYRFTRPKSKEYPYIIELFSRKADFIEHDEDETLTPIPMDDEISSLSAILLNDDYYDFLLDGQIVVQGIPVLKSEYLIPFKAKAWLDLRERKAAGVKVDSKDIRKHKNDVFRLTDLMTRGKSMELPEAVKSDMRTFLDAMEDEEIDLKSLGIRGANKATRMNLLYDYYRIKRP